MQQLVKKEYRVPFILVTSLFFLWGFAHAILDVLNKHFQDVMQISRTHSAWVQVMFYLGYFVMAIPAGLFISRHGYRRGVVLGLLLYGIGTGRPIDGSQPPESGPVVQRVGLYLRPTDRWIVVVLRRRTYRYFRALCPDGCSGAYCGVDIHTRQVTRSDRRRDS